MLAARRKAAIGTVAIVLFVAGMASPALAAELRKVIPLDGPWEIAEGAMEKVPDKFDHRIQVPGLADMAMPAFDEVGTKSLKREAFWYRRTFTIEGEVPAVALLKIHKACYTTRVFLNGERIGDHVGSFTPGYFDLRKQLRGKGETNELIVRVGAFRDAVPAGRPDGWDFEKIKYIPGIYDSVELILTGTPHVVRVQAVPEIEKKGVDVRAVVRNDAPAVVRRSELPTRLTLEVAVREAKSGKLVGGVKVTPVVLKSGEEKTVHVGFAINNCRLWSPEDPFLYELEVKTGADSYKTRFGMRSFGFDRDTGRAILNGRPYFMRGTNVCIYRFFEDPSRGNLPWRAEWVRRLHQRFKDMYWNSIRYCIGFPPEAWYDIADEVGFLIQDEFPIWGLSRKDLLSGYDSKLIAEEYTEWMQERWNHPCVVIWDAQNETVTEETGKAIAAVRGLDLSNRPWDNGWSPPQGPDDPVESHPYMASNPNFKLADIAGRSGDPNLRAGQAGHPIIINEYGWLWLTRDGKPTTLTRKVWENLLGRDPTPEQLCYTYARYLAAKTEFWRSHRKCAAVMHFCGLGYSRPDGQTSDHFGDLEKLTLEPHFDEYMRNAFAPVGLMIDEWAEDLPAGEKRNFPVVVINDRDEKWSGPVHFSISDMPSWTTYPPLSLLGGKGLSLVRLEENCELEPLGRKTLTFSATIPTTPGKYQLVAKLSMVGKKTTMSLRDFEVLTAEQKRARMGLAVGKPVKASSEVTVNGETFLAKYAVDGNRATRWSSEFSDPQWIVVDLGEPVEISRVELIWEAAYARAYAIQVSDDGENWKEVYKTESSRGGTEVIRFAPTKARWVRMYGIKRATPHGYSLWEMKVFR
jgi:hypothetical protein